MTVRRLLLGLVLSPLAVGLAPGCAGDTTVTLDDCSRPEGLDPEACLLPWPSSQFLVADPSTRTGFRVSLPAGDMPRNNVGDAVDPAPWNRWDGFSAMTTLIAELASRIDPTPLPGWHDPGRSLAPDSPTVIVDVDTGERVAHFAEIESSPEVAPDHTTIYIRPARRLAEGHHYAVGIRGLRNQDGTDVAVSRPFQQLRDAWQFPLTGRALAFARDVFAPLAAAGVDRSTLLLAWDFRTASGETSWGDLVAMRDDAVAAAGVGGLGCSVTNVVEDPSDTELFRRIEGQITVPSFLEAAPGGGLRIARDAAGRPRVVGTAQAPFLAMVPRSAVASLNGGLGPAPVWIYGHGLFSDRNEVTRDFGRATAAQGGAVIAATDFTGLTAGDESAALASFQNLTRFPTVMDRLRQSLINTLLLPRTIAGACASLPAFQTGGRVLVSATNPGYFSNSMGACLGPTLAALTPDIDHWALGVGGINFPLMMPRNARWPEIELVYGLAYPRRLDRDLLTVMSAHEWELVEGSFAPHVLSEPLPGSRPVQVLLQIGLYDADIANVASEMSARTLGLPALTPAARTVWGLTPAAAPLASAFVPYDEGAAPTPTSDSTLPPTENGVHEAVRLDPRALSQLVSFLRGRGVLDTCAGACRAP